MYTVLKEQNRKMHVLIFFFFFTTIFLDVIRRLLLFGFFYNDLENKPPLCRLTDSYVVGIGNDGGITVGGYGATV